MNGFPAGVPGVPAPESMMTQDQSAEYARELRQRADDVFRDVTSEHAQAANVYLDTAQAKLGAALQAEYDAVQNLEQSAGKRLQRPINAHAKAAGDLIQQAYDTIRFAGHEPVTDIVTIQELLNDPQAHARTLRLLQGSGEQGDVDERMQSGVLPQASGQGVYRIPDSAAGEVQRPGADQVLQRRVQAQERFAQAFGQPGEVAYEIARNGYPDMRLPDDEWVAPEGTPVIPHDGSGCGPDGYCYSAGSGGYVPIASVPMLQATAASLTMDEATDLPIVDEPLPPPTVPPPPPPAIPPPPPPGLPPGAITDGPTYCAAHPGEALYSARGGINDAPAVYFTDFDSAYDYALDLCGDSYPFVSDREIIRPRIELLGSMAVCQTTQAGVPQVLIEYSTCPGTPLPPPPPPPPTTVPPTVPPPPPPTLDLSGCYRLVRCDDPTSPPPPPPPADDGDDEPSEPPPPPPPPATVPKSELVGWDDPDICTGVRAKWEASAPVPDETSASYLADVFRRMEQRAADQVEAAPLLWAWVPKLVETATGNVAGLFDTVDTLIREYRETQAANRDVTSDSAANGYAATLGIVNWITRISGAPVDYLNTDLQYTMRYASPQLLPTQSGLDLLYLVNSINDEQWECWTRAQGNLPNSHRMARDAAQLRLNMAEVVELFMRGVIDREQLDDEARKRGVIDRTNVDRWIRLRRQLPTESDLIPFMTRDVVNPSIDWSASDEWFQTNYSGPVENWGEQLGIDPEVMRMRARAHWQLPSNTALYEMMARLRPGRRQDGLTVDYEQARRLLMQNDMEPSWIDRLLAISYLPPTRTDIKMGIKTRSIKTIAEAKELLLDARIDPEYADTLVRILWDDAHRQLANESNLWSRAKIIKAFKDGAINRERATELLGRFVPDADLIESALNDADEQVQLDIRRECIKAIKNRVLRAEITQDEAVDELVSQGVPPPRAVSLAAGFVCYRQSRGTELTLRYLHKIFMQGILGMESLYIRLRNLRYTEEDAQLVMQSWGIELEARRIQDAEKEARRRISELRGARSRYRGEVMFRQKQYDRREKAQKADPPKPDDTVDSQGGLPPTPYIPPQP